jgi:hypothetical protein
MNKSTWTLVCAVLATACSDTTAPVARTSETPRLAVSGGNTRCVGTLPPGTYQNVTVPEGESCVLENSIVLGSVTAREDSRLTLFNVRVEENVHGLKADVVSVFAFPFGAGSVGGNIHVHGADSPNALFSVFINNLDVTRGNIHVEMNNAGGIGVINNTVALGNILIQNNAAVFFNTIRDNRIAQNLVVIGNSGPAPKTVQNNFLPGKVLCFGNDEPFIGGPNFAQSSEGQCF